MKSLIIWDRDNAPILSTKERLIYWKGFSSQNSSNYISSFIDNKCIYYRNKILNELNILLKRIDELKLFENLNDEIKILILEMSLISEKNIHKSKSFYEALKCIALNDIIKKGNHIEIKYYGNNKRVKDSINLICKLNKIKFYDYNTFNLFGNSSLSLKNLIYTVSRNFLPSLILLIWNIFYYKFIQIKNAKWIDKNNSIFIISYLFNFDHQQLRNGSYYSNQWKILPEVLKEKNKKLNWLHLLTRKYSFRNIRNLINEISLLNKNSDKEKHFILESFFDFGILKEVLVNYFKIYFFCRPKIMKTSTAFEDKNNLFLWPIFKTDIEKSFLGTNLINNLFYIFLFKKIISFVPNTNYGIYLYENQSWEKALLYYWYNYQKNDLIGVSHSSIKFWELQYFDEKKCVYNRKVPSPSKIFLNGQGAYSVLKNANQNMNLYTEVEALRFMYLNKFQGENNHQDFRKIENILVVGDINSNTSEKMLKIIFSFARESYINYIFRYKPHPQNQNTFFKANFKGIKFTKENIEDLFKKSDLVICSNSTTTAIECCYAGIPLFTYLDNNNFNLSPLKEMNGSKFFSNYADFDALMKLIEKEKYDFKFNKNYFCVDESLTNWNEKFISKISNK